MDMHLEFKKESELRMKQMTEAHNSLMDLRKADIEFAKARKESEIAHRDYWRTMAKEGINHDRTMLSILKGLNSIHAELRANAGNV